MSMRNDPRSHRVGVGREVAGPIAPQSQPSASPSVRWHRAKPSTRNRYGRHYATARMSREHCRVSLSASAKRCHQRDLPVAIAPVVVGFVYGPLADDPHHVGSPLHLGSTDIRPRGAVSTASSTPSTMDEVLVRVVHISHRA